MDHKKLIETQYIHKDKKIFNEHKKMKNTYLIFTSCKCQQRSDVEAIKNSVKGLYQKK